MGKGEAGFRLNREGKGLNKEVGVVGRKYGMGRGGIGATGKGEQGIGVQVGMM